jgi:microcystin-dependent protein
MDAFLGEIRAMGFGFNPQNWMLCAGQILPIQQYTALFSLLGTTYGGNGTTTFQLPNLQGQVAVSSGQSTIGQNYDLGETGGAANVTLLAPEMPAHTHTANGANATQPIVNTVSTPANNTYIANPVAKTSPTTGTPGRGYAPTTATPIATLNPMAVGLNGSTLPHNNMMPYLAINYCICINGYFPQRP